MAQRLPIILLILCSLSGVAAAQSTNPAEALLDAYVGSWRAAEVHQTRDGREFHFEYRLNWFDEQHTITKLHITQVFHDGERRLLWEGFKGLDATDGSVYYHGFSPSGRVGTGSVSVADDGTLVTDYRGFSAGSEPVMIRDEFTPVEDDGFVSVTRMRPNEDAEWRQIGRDTWQRMKTASPDSI